MMSPSEAYEYRNVLLDFPAMRCWYCERDMGPANVRPSWWAGPWFLHRAHIVNHPRADDRRAITLLCPICHGLHHGERYPQLPDAKRPTLEELLWLKRTKDPQWYDRAWLQRHSIRKLPRARRPK